jgi:hypothetical protein
MADNWDTFVDSLVETPVEIQTKTATEQKYICTECAGTGLYQHTRVYQDKKHCFACRGKGYFKTDPRKLAKQREQRAAKKQALIEAAQRQNAEQEVYSEVVSMASWNSFAASLVEQHEQGKAWSEKQVAAVASMIYKIQETKRKKLEEAAAVDLSPIVSMFQYAKNNGYKRPVYRAEGLKISLAPESGSNAGALYIKDMEGLYLGKVAGGKFFASRDATDEQKQAVFIIAQDPKQAAIRYGQQTGSCSCCGRTLSNKQSIELGIGPVCASRWQLV